MHLRAYAVHHGIPNVGRRRQCRSLLIFVLVIAACSDYYALVKMQIWN